MNIKLIYILIISSFLISCSQDQIWQIDHQEGIYNSVDSSSINYQDSEMVDKIAPYKHKLDSAMDEVIAYSPKEYFKKKPNGTLNNIVCDMVFDVVCERYRDSEFKPDLCLLNYGGLRRPLPKGNITKSDIFQFMPFQNESVICRLNGTQMNRMFDYLQKSNGQPISNMRVYYSGGKFRDAFINGEKYDSTKTYNVLTSDYTAKGGDRMNFFLEADTLILCGSLIRNDIFSFIAKLDNESLIASDEDRIFFIELSNTITKPHN